MDIKEKLKLGQFQVDESIKQITFTDLRYYKYGEDYFPSVSTILDAYPKNYQFYEWLKREGENADNIRDAAASSGSLVHQATEAYDKGETVSLFDSSGRIKYSTREWSLFEKYVQFSNQYKPEVISIEENLVSTKLRIGGTLDRRLNLTLGGTTTKLLIDIKTSNMMHNHFWLQLAAYKKLYEEFHPDDPIDGTAILWLNAKTRGESKTKGIIQGRGWQLVFPDKDNEYYWDLFQATQKLWEVENASAKPNNLTYTIEHSKTK